MERNQCTAQIISNRAINRDFYDMELSCPEIASAARPGQFIMVDTGSNHVPYIKRPFAIAGADRGAIRIIYKIAGSGTQILSGMPAKREITVIGPLGNGYAIPSHGKRILLVAGGAGLSSVMSLLPELKCRSCTCHLVIGARNADGVLLLKHFQDLGVNLHISTEDGSMGYAGFPTPVVQALLTEYSFDAAFVCGPKPMMRAVSQEILRAGVPCQVSLEQRMGCGFGVCVGCSCKILDPEKGIIQKRVCKEGPVFDAKEVVWDG